MKTNQFKTAVLILVLVVFCVGLISPAVQGSFGERFERALGNSAAPELIKQYGGVYTVPLQERLWLEEVFRRLTEVTERTELNYTLTVLNSGEFNAFALPGGYVFITKGLLRNIGYDDAKLAAVLGHELAHIEKKHGMAAVLRQMGLTILTEVGALWLDVVPPDVLRMASATLLQLLQLGWGREAEYEADLIGQQLAVEAGFNAVGAVTLLDDLLQLESADLPMKVFRTHPDTLHRRHRAADNLLSFWSLPEKNKDQKLVHGRSFGVNGRNDPKGRYNVTKGAPRGLYVRDIQLEQDLFWLESYLVKDFAWSAHGEYFGAIVSTENRSELWILNRYGNVLTKRGFDKDLAVILSFSWSPRDEMLALEVKTGGEEQVLVTYLGTEVYLDVTRELGGNGHFWLENKLYFHRGDSLYVTSAPKVKPVVVPNRVPRVIQRQRVLTPTIVREDNRVRLTRPSIVLP